MEGVTRIKSKGIFIYPGIKKKFIFFFTLMSFFLLVSVFLDIRIYRDHTLLVGDTLYYADPTFNAFDGGIFFNTQPSNPLMDTDNYLHNYPFRYYTQASFARGEIPWWNPYVGMGVPFVGLGSGAFDPVAALAGLLAPATKLTNVIAVSALWIAACGMFVFLGTLSLSLSARIFGAVAFTFCGWTIVWLGRANFMAEIWMPWIFWAAERLIRRRNAPRIGLLALFSGLICLSGHLQTSFHIFAGLSLYVLFRIFQEKLTLRGRAGFALSAGLALALGIGIALIQILPFSDLLAQVDLPPLSRSIQLQADDAFTAIRYSIQGDRPVMKTTIPTAITAISPFFFGAPHHSNTWWPWSNFPSTTLYIGLLPLFFALYGFSKIKVRRDLYIWLTLTVVSLGVVYSLPIFNLVNYLPGFDKIDNGRLRLMYRFPMIIAAAIGFGCLTSNAKQRSDKAALYLAGGYALVVIALPVAVFWSLPLTPLGKAVFTKIGAENLWMLVKSAQIPVLVLLALSAVTIMAWKLRLIGNTAFRTVVVLLTFADLFWFFHDFNPIIPSYFVFPETNVVKFLKKDPTLFRVSSSTLGHVMPPDTKLIYGISDIDLFSTLTVGRYASVQSLINPPLPLNVAQRNFRFVEPASYKGLINLMNVKYIVLPAWENTLDPEQNAYSALGQYRRVYNREVLIYQNIEVLPRAFLVNRSKILDRREDILGALVQPDFDPRAAVLLDDPGSPSLPEHSNTGSSGNADIVSYTSNRVVVRASTPAPAYLVLSDVYYPGWKATVDGLQTPIYPAYHLFRAIYLEPGTHEIIFTFSPKSYTIVWSISLACLAITFLLIMATVIKRRGL